MKKLIVLTLVACLIMSGCCGRERLPTPVAPTISLPAPPRSADLKGNPPRKIQVVFGNGEVGEGMLVPEKDFREILRELRQLRSWRDAVRMIHKLKPVEEKFPEDPPDDAPHSPNPI